MQSTATLAVSNRPGSSQHAAPLRTAASGARQVGDDMNQDILAELGHLRAFAHFLARDHALAEDLVQDTIVRALSCRHQFRPGTNLRGWLTTILRNRYFNEIRPRARPGILQAELSALGDSTSGGQEERLEMRDFMRAFESLPATHREALLLVGAQGVSHEAAARIANCAVGTIKSRVSRARAQLQRLLADDEPRRDRRQLPAAPSQARDR
ncbi:MAG TPA: sigma-70 family RNA polymerase sigma factor [Stellaceae bacterium]|nr:sigma-70 family RNA polymerase sigma factor [Stellaceae bacterium]